MKTQRIAKYDGIKGIAILGITLIHCILWSGLWIPIQGFSVPVFNILLLGSYGVEVTFVLNGYLTGTQFLRQDSVSPIQFLRRSVSRILLPYYAALTIHLILEWTITHRIDKTPMSVLSNYLLFNGINPYWQNAFGLGYVGTITLAWLVYPPLMTLQRNLDYKKRILIAAAISAISYGIVRLLWLHPPISDVQLFEEWSYFTLRAVYGYCVAAMVCAASEHLPSLLPYIKKGLIGCVAVLLVQICFFTVSHFLFTLAFGLYLLLVIDGRGKWLAHPILVFPGKHIFLIYLLQFTVYYLFRFLAL